MRKADLINKISDKTGIPKVDVLVTLETMFREIKASLAGGENLYIRGSEALLLRNGQQRLAVILKKM